MNVSSLSKEDIEHKQGDLPVALYPNRMVAEDEKPSFYAMTISRGVCTDEDIANDMMLAGLNEDVPKEKILRILTYARNARFARLADGYAVYDGINKYQLKVKGVFTSESDSFSSERHSVSISTHPTAEAEKHFTGIVPVIRQGNSRKPEITSVFDAKSKSDTVLSKAGFLEIQGANILVCGDDEEIGLYFVNEEDASKTVKLSADDLGMNKSTRLACVVPADLESGTYSIKVVTQFMRGKTFRKKAQQTSFGHFSVE